MATSSLITALISLTGDVLLTETLSLGNNASSPGKVDLLTLASGANTITVPTSGTTPTGCVIIPPNSNSVSITLKGVTGDTGVRVHNTFPTYLSLDSSVTTFVLTAGNTITGLRIYWL